MAHPICTLQQGRERSLLNRHPWVFSGAIRNVDIEPETGQIVDVESSDGRFLARGYFNPNSQIRVRVLTFADESIDTDFFAQRLRVADRWRRPFLDGATNAYRICHSEGDFLPGLIVDRYGDFLAAQFLTSGIEALKSEITDALIEVFSPEGIYEKSEGGYRKEEGLEQAAGPLYGQEPPELLRITENSMPFYVDIVAGQKTGFFLDQRGARKLAHELADGRTVLNCFGYSGAFTVACLTGGAKRVITVDTSKTALEMARKNVELAGYEIRDEDFVIADVFNFLREYDGEADFIILDPPAFAKSRAAVQRASRGYKDINFNAIRRLDENGLLLTCSCSGHMNVELFQKILFAASHDAGKGLQILARLSHGFDHPLSIYHPEGDYLKGALCRVHGRM
jgi:23S rRNA (cytosine1962-C5)-methyltransferase